MNIVEANNYGAIKYNIYNDWNGQIGQTSQGFVVFDTYQHGIRAITVLLKNYLRFGIDTVTAIIRRYSATDQETYIHFVSSRLSVLPYDTITENQLNEIVSAIVRYETGKIELSANEIQEIRNIYNV